MRYRIKIITYANGRKEYYPYVRKGWYWFGLDWYGAPGVSYSCLCDKRETALMIIDKHYVGNSKVQRIDFEYINK